MDSLSAFARGNATRHDPLMVFDWDKAAQILRDRKAQNAEAGLSSDWEYTGGAILRDGQPVMDAYTYLASTWARPQLSIEDDYLLVECFRPMEGSGWDESTKWPKSALDIFFNGKGES